MTRAAREDSPVGSPTAWIEWHTCARSVVVRGITGLSVVFLRHSGAPSLGERKESNGNTSGRKSENRAVAAWRKNTCRWQSLPVGGRYREGALAAALARPPRAPATDLAGYSPSPLNRANDQSTSPPGMAMPEMWRPICCVTAGRQGTRLNPSPSSIMASPHVVDLRGGPRDDVQRHSDRPPCLALW
jgi:hypothetical protein